VTQQFIALNSF